MITINEINELIEVVGRHAEKYPLAQPCDAVKLISKRIFGRAYDKKCGTKPFAAYRRVPAGRKVARRGAF